MLYFYDLPKKQNALMKDVEYLTTKRFFKVIEKELGLTYNKDE